MTTPIYTCPFLISSFRRYTWPGNQPHSLTEIFCLCQRPEIVSWKSLALNAVHLGPRKSDGVDIFFEFSMCHLWCYICSYVLFDLAFRTALWSRHCYIYFKDTETESEGKQLAQDHTANKRWRLQSSTSSPVSAHPTTTLKWELPEEDPCTDPDARECAQDISTVFHQNSPNSTPFGIYTDTGPLLESMLLI